MDKKTFFNYGLDKEFLLNINFIGLVAFCVLIGMFLIIKIKEAASEFDNISQTYNIAKELEK